MDFIGGIISSISGYMYSYVLIALLIAAGLYFSFRTKFVQIRFFKESIRIITEQAQFWQVAPEQYFGCGSLRCWAAQLLS